MIFANVSPTKRLTNVIKDVFTTMDKPLLFMIFLVFLISCVAVYSASHDEIHKYYQHLRNLVIAASLIVILARIPSVFLEKLAIPTYVITIFLLMATEFFGETINGATRWINLGFVKMQPSEIMKIALPLVMAWFVQKNDGLNTKRDWFFCVLLLLLPVTLILRQPDLGTAILIIISGLVLLFFAGLSWKIVLFGVCMFTISVTLLIVFGESICQEGINWPGLRQYQKLRICTLLNPMSDPLGAGFHTIQSVTAVGSGGFIGKGWLLGTQTQLAFIPERATDFVFSGFAEEFGFLGSLILVLLYCGITLRGLWIALGAPTQFARLLAGTLSLMTFTYACVNIGMVTGLLPVVGIPLPWVSYGGTALITLSVGTGLIMSVARDRSFTTQGFSFQN